MRLLVACAVALLFIPLGSAGGTPCSQATHGVQVSLTDTDYVGTENAGNVTLGVERAPTDTTACQIEVHFRTSADSASRDQDYIHASGDVLIPVGERSVTFKIRLLDDADAEGVETFLVDISISNGAGSIGANNSAEVFIQDDDASSAGSTTTVTTTKTETSTGSSTTVTQTITDTKTVTSPANTTTVTVTADSTAPAPGAGVMATVMAVGLLAAARRR